MPRTVAAGSGIGMIRAAAIRPTREGSRVLDSWCAVGARTLQELPAPLHHDRVACAEILARQTGQPLADPMKLIVPMLERFIATDREFAKARRQTTRSAIA